MTLLLLFMLSLLLAIVSGWVTDSAVVGLVAGVDVAGDGGVCGVDICVVGVCGGGVVVITVAGGVVVGVGVAGMWGMYL